MIEMPESFRSYVVDGDHWRHGERRTAIRRAQDGYTGPMHAVTRDGGTVARVELHPRFVEHMDSAPWTEASEKRWRAVEDALAALKRDGDAEREREIKAWRFLACPEHFRTSSTVGYAILLEVDVSTLYRSRDRVSAWTWERLALWGAGGYWQ